MAAAATHVGGRRGACDAGSGMLRRSNLLPRHGGQFMSAHHLRRQMLAARIPHCLRARKLLQHAHQRSSSSCSSSGLLRHGSSLARWHTWPRAQQALVCTNEDTEQSPVHTSPDSGGATRSRRHVILAGAAICAWPSTDLLAGGDASTFLPAAASFVVEYPMATEFLKYTPIVLCQAMFLTGMKDMQKIKAQGSTGDIDSLPFVSMAVNCSVWCAYGAFMENMTIIVPNVTGLVLGVGYTMFYHQNATDTAMATLQSRYAIGAGIVAAVGALTVGKVSGALDAIGGVPVEQVLGVSAAIFSIVLMSSPLGALARVVKTQDASSMNTAMSVFILANASSWTLFGLLVADDPNCWVPNALGAASAVVQLALIARYSGAERYQSSVADASAEGRKS